MCSQFHGHSSATIKWYKPKILWYAYIYIRFLFALIPIRMHNVKTKLQWLWLNWLDIADAATATHKTKT